MDCTQDFGCSQLEENEDNIEVASLKLKDEQFPILMGNNVLGRDAECCSIVVNNASLSRKHAVIVVEDRCSHYIIDLDSKNKTRVNKKRLIPYQRTRLSHQTLVEFGEVSAEYHILLEQDKGECHQVVPESDDEIVPETPVQCSKYGHESSSNSTSPTIFQMSTQCDCGDANTCGKLLGEPCGMNFISKQDISNTSATLVDRKLEATLDHQKLAGFKELIPSNKAKDTNKINETDLSGDETDPEDLFSNKNVEGDESTNKFCPSGLVEVNETAEKSVEESNLVDEIRDIKENSSETDMSGDEERGSEDLFNALTQMPPKSRNASDYKETVVSGDIDSIPKKVNEGLYSNQEVLQEPSENLSEKGNFLNKGEATTNFLNDGSSRSPEKSASQTFCDLVTENVHSNDNIETGVTNCLEGENISCSATRLVTSCENKLPPEKDLSHKLSESLEENFNENDTGVSVTNCPGEELFCAATQLVPRNENNSCLKQNCRDHEAKESVDLENSSSLILSAATKESVVVALDNNPVDSNTDTNICDGIKNVDRIEEPETTEIKLLFNSEVNALCDAQTQIIPHAQGGKNNDDNHKLISTEDAKCSTEDIFNAATEVLICTNSENEACVGKSQEEEDGRGRRGGSTLQLCASIFQQTNEVENMTKSLDESNVSDECIFESSTQLVHVVEEGPSHKEGTSQLDPESVEKSGQEKERFAIPTHLAPKSVERSMHEEEIFLAPSQLKLGGVEKTRHEEELFLAPTQLVPGDTDRSKHEEEIFVAPTQLLPGDVDRSEDEEEMFVAPTQLVPGVPEKCRVEYDMSLSSRESAPEVDERSNHEKGLVLKKGDEGPSDSSENIATVESEKGTNPKLKEDPNNSLDESFFVASTQIVSCKRFPGNTSYHPDEAKSPASTCSSYSSIHEAPTQCMDEIEGVCIASPPKSTIIEGLPLACCSTKEGGVNLEEDSRDGDKTYPTHFEVSSSPNRESENITLILPSTEEFKKTAHDMYGDSSSETDEMQSPILQTRTRCLRNKKITHNTAKNATKRKLNLSTSDSESVESCMEEGPDVKPSHKRSARTEKRTVSKLIVNKGGNDSKNDNNASLSKENNESKKEGNEAMSKGKSDSKKKKSKAVSKGKGDSKKEKSKNIKEDISNSKKDTGSTVSTFDENSIANQQSGAENMSENRSGRPSRLRKMTWKARDSYDCPRNVPEESKSLEVKSEEVKPKKIKKKHLLGKVDVSGDMDPTVSILTEENNTPMTRNSKSSKMASEKRIVSGRLQNQETQKKVRVDVIRSSRENDTPVTRNSRSSKIASEKRIVTGRLQNQETQKEVRDDVVRSSRENDTPVTRNSRSSKIASEKKIVSGRLQKQESQKEARDDEVRSSRENDTPVTRNSRSSKIASEKKIVSGRLQNQETQKEVRDDDVKSSRERSGQRRKRERATSDEKESIECEINKKKIVLKEKFDESSERNKIGCSKFYGPFNNTQDVSVLLQRRNKSIDKDDVANIPVESEELLVTKEKEKEKGNSEFKKKIDEKESEKETIVAIPKGRREQKSTLKNSKGRGCNISISQNDVHINSENGVRKNTRRRNSVMSGIDPQPCVESSLRRPVRKKDVRTKLKPGDSDSEAKKQEIVVLPKERDGADEEKKGKTRFSKRDNVTREEINSAANNPTVKSCSNSPERGKGQRSSCWSPNSTIEQRSVDIMKNTKLKDKKVSNVDTCISSADSESMLESPIIKTRARKMPVKGFAKTWEGVGPVNISIIEGKMEPLSKDLSTPCEKKRIVSRSASSQSGDDENTVAAELKQSCLKGFRKQNVSNSPTTRRLKRTNQSDSSESLSCSGESTPKRSCRLNVKVHYNIMFTGVTATNTEENTIKKLGGKFVDEIEDCTVLITDKVRRTFKFLCILGQGKPIVSARWLEESRLKGHFLDPWNFIVHDKEAEKKFKFSLEQSLKRACDKKLLEGYSVHATPSVLPPPTEMKGIVQCCGGKYLSREPSSTSWPQKSFVIASANDKKLLGKIKNKVPVVSPELILTGVLQQKLDFKEHSFKC